MRHHADDSLAEIQVGCLAIDPGSRRACVCDRPVELTAKEFELLHHFARYPGRVFRRTELLDSVWGYGHDGYEHTVNSHINRLRKKIEQDPARARYILTVWGGGYKFADAASEQVSA
jgi:two-component system OmpR family response regulator